jgi:hypothetical protein
MKLKWRLSKLPSVEELRELVKDKILTRDEAKEILFSSTSEEDREKESFKEEIKFLRELVDILTKDRSVIIEKIKYIDRPYREYQWYRPYEYWCGTGTGTHNTIATLGGITTTSDVSGDTTNAYYGAGGGSSSFTDIKTF